MIRANSAGKSEQAACLALLPELWGMPAELIAAREDGALVGAAGLIWESWAEPAGFRLSLHVLADSRRRGVGRVLIEAADALISGETDGLWSFRPMDEDAPAAHFLRACGFDARKRSIHYEAEVASFHGHVARLVDRLRRSGRIPTGARTMSVRDAPLEEVAWLVASEFPGGPAQTLARLRRSLEGQESDSLDLDRSVALMVDDQLAGVLFGRWNDGQPLIEARVIAPKWRHSFVNALLIEASSKRVLDDGATQVRFDTDEHGADTINLVRHGNARFVGATATFYRAAQAAMATG